MGDTERIKRRTRWGYLFDTLCLLFFLFFAVYGCYELFARFVLESAYQKSYWLAEGRTVPFVFLSALLLYILYVLIKYFIQSVIGPINPKLDRW